MARRGLLLSLAAHGAVAMALVARPAPRASAPPAPERTIEIEVPRAPTENAPAAVAAMAGPAVTTPTRAVSTSPAIMVTVAAPSDAPTGGDAGWFDPLRHATTPPRLLGRRVELAPAPAIENTPHDDGAITAVRDALGEHDRSLGLGRAGPLEAAAHDAASAGPDTGIGQLEIDCDGEGRVVAVRTLQSDWQPVAARLARVMAARTVRVRPGSHGLRVKLRIVAERTPEAGKPDVKATPGAVPDEACDGSGLTRRCVAGMPVGVTVKGQDLANIGARIGRIVHVNVDGETDL